MRSRSRYGPEYYEACLLTDWLTVHKIMHTHFPAGELRSKATGRKLKRMGLLKGVSDYIIFDPPQLPGYDYAFTFIELKAKKKDGGKNPTTEQSEFLDAMSWRGHLAGLFFGADEAIDWLKSLGYGGGR